MAAQAYVFVHATPGKWGEAGKTIAEIEGVKSAHACWRRPDVKATDTRLLIEM